MFNTNPFNAIQAIILLFYAGKVENERFLSIALHQGAARKSKVTVTMETLDKIPQRDPTIVAVAFKRQRIYLLSKREPQVVIIINVLHIYDLYCSSWESP